MPKNQVSADGACGHTTSAHLLHSCCRYSSSHLPHLHIQSSLEMASKGCAYSPKQSSKALPHKLPLAACSGRMVRQHSQHSHMWSLWHQHSYFAMHALPAYHVPFSISGVGLGRELDMDRCISCNSWPCCCGPRASQTPGLNRQLTAVVPPQLCLCIATPTRRESAMRLLPA